MNFILIWQNYKWVILFYLGIILLLYLNRKKFEFQGKIVALYRTKVGLGLMDRVSNKYRELIKLLGYCAVGIAYVALILIFGLLIKATIDLVLNKPGAAGAAPVLPGVPIAGTGLVFPLIIGWISLFIIVVVHEFSHGVVARAFKLKILNSGIVFFGPILGAFVEPDEKQLAKRPDIEQYSIFAAGPVSNVILALIAVLILGFLLTPVTNLVSNPIGVKIGVMADLPASIAGIPDNSIVTKLNGQVVTDIQSFTNISKTIAPNQTITIATSDKEYTLTTAEHPQDKLRGYLGVTLQENAREAKQGLFIIYKIMLWLNELFFWLYFISLNIGLINLFPIFITDGARILKTTVERLVADKIKALRIWQNINLFAVFILLLLLLLPLFRWVGIGV